MTDQPCGQRLPAAFLVGGPALTCAKPRHLGDDVHESPPGPPWARWKTLPDGGVHVLGMRI